MVEKTNKMHYAWFIFFGCCCLAAGTLALTVSLAGVYIIPGSQALGVGPGDFAMWLTVSGLVSVVVMPFWGQFLPKKTKLCTTLGCCFMIIGVILLSTAVGTSAYPILIAGGVCIGAGLPVAFTVTIPTLMGNWFAPKQRGKFLGIAMAFSGVGVFVWAPLFTFLLQTLGIQTALIINAVLIAVLTLPFTLFVFRFIPEEKGLAPFGAEKEGGTDDETKALHEGMSAKRAFGTVAFWTMLIALGLTSIGMGYNGSQPGIATELLAGTLDPEAAGMLGATMISVAAAGNLLGKIIFGWMTDRVGLRVTSATFLGATIVCFLIWIFLPSMPVMLIGAFLLGTHNGLYSVGYPLIVRSLFGSRDYSKIFSRLSMIGALIGGSATAIVGYIYQITGSFVGALYGGIALFLVIAVFVLITISYIGKLKWDETVTEREPEAQPQAR